MKSKGEKSKGAKSEGVKNKGAKSKGAESDGAKSKGAKSKGVKSEEAIHSFLEWALKRKLQIHSFHPVFPLLCPNQKS